MRKIKKITIKETDISVIQVHQEDYISLTDMLKAKDGDFFISDWLRNRNTVEFLGRWECINNPVFNYGEFAIIKSQAGLNRIAREQMGILINESHLERLEGDN